MLVESRRTDVVPPRHSQTRFPRAADHHFYLTAEVNGAPVRFLVDTGASYVLLRPEDAKRAGILVDASSYSVEARSASGDVTIAPTKLNQIIVGGVERRNVEAAVAPRGLDVSLLGQSFLAKLDSVVIRGDHLTIE